jgi:cytochrome c peroxidase
LFDTPTLVELWRTGPYLHTGAAATVKDVLTTCNTDGLHGNVAGLTGQNMNDLCEYLLSL